MGRFSSENIDSIKVETAGLSSADFDLLASLVRSQQESSEGMKAFLEFEKYINDFFLHTMDGASFAGQYAYYQEKQNILFNLRELVDFPFLANKKVVAIGGAFSSGKSRFLNTLMGKQILPVGNKPTTAVPTFLTNGEELSILTFNAFNNIQSVSVQELERLSHSMTAQNSSVELSTFIKEIQVKTPDIPWKNVALLDTPGYSKTESGRSNDTDDYAIAQRQIASADHLIWVVSAKAGTITASDIDFLNENSIARDRHRRIYILVNRADDRKSDIKSVMNRIEMDLDRAGLSVYDISAYSSLEEKLYIGRHPRSWLDDINGEIKYVDWQSVLKKFWNEVKNKVKDEMSVYAAINKNLRPLFLQSEIDGDGLLQVQQSLIQIKTKKEIYSKLLNNLETASQESDEMLSNLLKKLQIKDSIEQKKSAKAILTDCDNAYTDLKDDLRLYGHVVLKNAFGIYVRIDSMNKVARISYEELDKFYTNSDVWEIGADVELRVCAVKNGCVEFFAELA